MEGNINGTYILTQGVCQLGKTKGQPPDPNRDPVGQKKKSLVKAGSRNAGKERKDTALDSKLDKLMDKVTPKVLMTTQS